MNEALPSNSYNCATCLLALASPNAPCPHCLRETGNPWPHLKNPLVDLVDKPGLGAAMRHSIEQATAAARASNEQMPSIEYFRRSYISQLREWCDQGGLTPFPLGLAQALESFLSRTTPETLRDEVWQSIASCPKDGLPFLCGWWSPNSDYWWTIKAHWANGVVDGGWDGGRQPVDVHPTHWMPLPEPPALKAKATAHGYTCRKCGVWYAGPNGFHDCALNGGTE